MDEIEVLCIGAAIVDIPLQPVSKNIFDVDSYPLERIAMTTGGDAINEATIISRLGHRTALMRSRWRRCGRVFYSRPLSEGEYRYSEPEAGC